MTESSLTPRTKRLKLKHHSKLTTETNEHHLFHDGVLRCTKCTSIVQQLGEAGNSFLDDEEEHVPGHMAPKKWPRQNRRRLYEPNSLCITCEDHMLFGLYHKVGDHLMEAHESTGKENAVPIEGCCYLCLLSFQFKCRGGFLQSASTMSAQNGILIRFGLLWDLQFFSDSIDEPVRIDRYLPQGFKHIEENTIRIVPRLKIHWPSVRSWILSCEVGHECGQQLLRGSGTPSVNERIFIDVKHQNLVTCQYDCRYIALSYVWGGISQLLLTKSNKEAMFQNGGLKTFEGDIPQVIKDAMQFVSSIRERMLWVDSLCIVQDDESVKHHLISEMSSIFSGALVTIVAASGENAGFGLPGVSENSRVLQDVVEIPGTGLYVMNRRPLNLTMDDSTYNTRGWTFQERLLSRRCLYFTDTQIFFECQEHLYSEDRSGKQIEDYPRSGRTLRSGNLINKMLLGFEDPLDNKEEIQLLKYSELVEEYCHKKFTFVNDILNAFAGIQAAMEHLCGWSMIYGLPEQLLDRAILWEPEGDTSSQQTLDCAFFPLSKAETSLCMRTDKLEVRNLEFPSWSWSAWIGGIRYNQWTRSDLRVLHSPFKMVHQSFSPCTSQSTLNNHKPSVLSFSSECLPGSIFSLKTRTFRNQQTCLILNAQRQSVGTIPGVESTFAGEYDSNLVDMVLLSASKLAVHRFRSPEDIGYPSLFDARYPRNDWSVLTIMFVKWNKDYAKRIALAYIHRDAWKEADPKVKPIILA